MADDKVAETEAAAAVEAAVQPEEAEKVESAMETKEDAAPTAATNETPEDTYESVEAPAADKTEAEKTNGTAAAEGIEVPLDENEAAAQPLTGEEKDVEAGTSEEVPAKDKSASLVAGARIIAALKKREILFPVIGGLTFLLGLILIISGLMVMQGKCDQAMINGNTATNGKDDSMRYGDSAHMSPHNSNVTFDEGELENLAEGRIAFQSTTFNDVDIYRNASLATDGNTGNSVTKEECAQTERQEHPYWYVDLGSEKLVKRVKIVLPSNCCGGEMHDFEVRVGGDKDVANNGRCKHYMGTALQHYIAIPCDEPLSGRFVSIHMLGRDGRSRDRLTLCEVMVY